jgi:hypothetical protein
LSKKKRKKVIPIKQRAKLFFSNLKPKNKKKMIKTFKNEVIESLKQRSKSTKVESVSELFKLEKPESKKSGEELKKSSKMLK